ncbi:MAG: 3-hydroxyacyl-CoA dehydrogenase NAD-binding domain-containing protein, partial [Candidatus Sulfotelmatobacter sp.]
MFAEMSTGSVCAATATLAAVTNQIRRQYQRVISSLARRLYLSWILNGRLKRFRRVNAMEIKRVGLIGAGTMGSGIAQIFAGAGYSVVLCDVEQRFLNRGLETIIRNLDRE